MKNLDDIYRELLGNPQVGDLAQLDRHYRAIKDHIEKSKDQTRVDISTIQKYGELHNAYLYLKAQWTIKRQQDSGLILEDLNLTKNKSKEITKKTQASSNYKSKDSTPSEFLQSIYKCTKNLTRAGIIIILCIFFTKFGIYLGKSEQSDRKLAVNNNKQESSQIRDKKEENQVNPITNISSNQKEQKVNLDISKNTQSFSNKSENIDKAIDIKNQELPLITAAKSCSIDQLENVYSKNSKINEVDEYGQTIAHWLSRLNCVSGLKWAVTHNINIDHRDKSGRTALDWAKISNSYESIQYLNNL